MNTPGVPPERPSQRLAPQLSCDIVMKGGITSGIVYPGAIVEFARRYRFRNIGGASAGAIAAAATAAAEFGRETGGGFSRLDTVPGDLGVTEGGESRMLDMFKPDPRPAPSIEPGGERDQPDQPSWHRPRRSAHPPHAIDASFMRRVGSLTVPGPRRDTRVQDG